MKRIPVSISGVIDASDCASRRSNSRKSSCRPGTSDSALWFWPNCACSRGPSSFWCTRRSNLWRGPASPWPGNGRTGRASAHCWRGQRVRCVAVLPAWWWCANLSAPPVWIVSVMGRQGLIVEWRIQRNCAKNGKEREKKNNRKSRKEKERGKKKGKLHYSLEPTIQHSISIQDLIKEAQPRQYDKTTRFSVYFRTFLLSLQVFPVVFSHAT